MFMNNNKHIIKAISHLSVAIEYLTWALESETKKGQIEWVDDAIKKIKDAKYWIYKSNISPF